MSKLAVAVLAAALAFSGSAQAIILYDNGAIKGTVDAWNITGFETSNSFDLSGASTVTGVIFGGWTDPGATITSLSWFISSAPLHGGIIYDSGVAPITGSSFFGTALSTYDVNAYSFDIGSLALSAGTYYLSLTSAVTTNGNAAYWDENDGPSTAFQSNGGAPTGSESFQILGTAGVPAPVPEPTTLSLLGLGLLGLGAMKRRKKPETV